MNYKKKTHIALFFILMASLPLWVCCSRTAQSAPAVAECEAQTLADYMRRFPQAQLQDVYKLCFQDTYGPGHIISDSLHCLQGILDEMQRMDTADTRYPDYEYTCTGGNYVRVNLRVLQDGRVPLQQFVQLLMQSATLQHPMEVSEWCGRWDDLLAVLDTVEPRPLNYEEDAANIRAVLESGETAVHHSRHFNEAYAPHYRIIRRDLFDKELLPLIIGD